jgi:hypothetical protein
MEPNEIKMIEKKIIAVDYYYTGRSVLAIATLKWGRMFSAEVQCQPDSVETTEQEAYKKVLIKIFEYEFYVEPNKDNEI